MYYVLLQLKCKGENKSNIKMEFLKATKIFYKNSLFLVIFSSLEVKFKFIKKLWDIYIISIYVSVTPLYPFSSTVNPWRKWINFWKRKHIYPFLQTSVFLFFRKLTQSFKSLLAWPRRWEILIFIIKMKVWKVFSKGSSMYYVILLGTFWLHIFRVYTFRL